MENHKVFSATKLKTLFSWRAVEVAGQVWWDHDSLLKEAALVVKSCICFSRVICMTMTKNV
jgi:hypothetical protein